MPTLDNILGNLVNQIPEQKLPDKETCLLISDVFSNLAEAHRYSATAAKGLADVANLVSPEQFTVVLAAAVPPTLHLVLLPDQARFRLLLHHLRSPKHQLRRQTGKSSSVASGAISKIKSQTACPAHKSSISLNGLPVWLQRACTSSSQGWHSAGFDPSNIFILSNCLSNLAFRFSSAWASTPFCMVFCNASANCVVVLCNASVMFVVLAFP